MSMPQHNRRKLRNLVQDPNTQYRHALYYFGFTVVAAFLMQTVLMGTIQQTVLQALAASGVDPSTIAATLQGPIRTYMWRAVILFPVLGLASMLFALRMTHRYLGPQVAIRRHLAALSDGDYTAVCRLRGADELQGIAADLNELAATLLARHGAGTHDRAA